MIASVVATLDASDSSFDEVCGQVAQLPGVQIGDFQINASRLPLTLDASSPSVLEDLTERLRQCEGVASVDVVFVHFDPEGECGSEAAQLE